ncbi:MAG: hypothetical protein CMJ62_04090 [Planctomycetaceae bacterium]|nr:hypothetical protein [Planctomycetaceae bacterium]
MFLFGSMSRARAVLFATVPASVLFVTPPVVSAQSVPFTIQGPGVHPAQFRITRFADGLTLPVGMLQLGDGSLLYGTTKNESIGFQTGTFEIRRLVDAAGDGVADNGIGDPLYSGPANAGGVTEIHRAGDLIVTLSNTVNKASAPSSRMTFLRPGALPGDPLSEVAALNITFPDNSWHMSHGMTLRTTGPEQHEVYFNIGSVNNRATTAGVGRAQASGSLSGHFDRDTIYRVQVDDFAGGVPVISGLKKIASGLRNAAGLAFHPTNGDLWFQDNGEDGSGNSPLGADELNRIAADQLGGAVEDFGFDEDYISYFSGNRNTSRNPSRDGIQPEVAFTRWNDDGTLRDNQGANQIAFSPAAFPGPLDNGVFVGFHGRFVGGGTANPENPLLFHDFDSGEFFHFIGAGQNGVGHLDGLLSTDDSLFVAELTSGGNFLSNPAPTNGAIYQIQAIAKPCDFDGNFACNTDDLDRMYSENGYDLVNGVSVASGDPFDLTGDDMVDNLDVTAWLVQAATENGYTSPYQRGDTYGLGKLFPEVRSVRLFDYNVLAGFFDPNGDNGPYLWHDGNFDGDRDIDLSDYNFLAANFNPTGYGPSQAVPEPASVVLCLLGLAVVVRFCP